MFLGHAATNPTLWKIFFNWKLTIIAIGLVTGVRFITVFSLGLVSRFVFRKKLCFKDQFLLSYGGLRGAIAFCLIQATTNDIYSDELKNVFTVTTIVVILFTTFIQGATIRPLVQILNVKLNDADNQKSVENNNQKVMEQKNIKKLPFSMKVHVQAYHQIVRGINSILYADTKVEWVETMKKFVENYLDPIFKKIDDREMELTPSSHLLKLAEDFDVFASVGKDRTPSQAGWTPNDLKTINERNLINQHLYSMLDQAGNTFLDGNEDSASLLFDIGQRGRLSSQSDRDQPVDNTKRKSITEKKGGFLSRLTSFIPGFGDSNQVAPGNMLKVQSLVNPQAVSQATATNDRSVSSTFAPQSEVSTPASKTYNHALETYHQLQRHDSQASSLCSNFSSQITQVTPVHQPKMRSKQNSQASLATSNGKLTSQQLKQQRKLHNQQLLYEKFQ